MSKIFLEESSSEELQKAIIEGVKLQLEQLKVNFQPKQPNKYLTRSETAEMLKIDLSTLYKWTKKGTLKSYGLNGRVYYKLDEVENSIVELKKAS